MARQEQTDVLVVGAGPAGMLTALILAQNGVRVRIIDQESRTASRTYACALHPRTLSLLDGLGLAENVMAAGRRVETVAFYEGATRQAEAKLSQVRAEFPCVVVLAQSEFERLLEEKLRNEYRVQIAWNHQLSDLRQISDSVLAVVDKLGMSAKGYIVPEMEWSVEKTEEVKASFVVGADGPNSHVAKCLGLTLERVGDPEFFAVYEFESNWRNQDELRVVLAPKTSSVLWPLPGNRFRWSFQLLEEHLAEFPLKERNSFTIRNPELDEENRRFVQKLIAGRAPWFTGSIQELGWSTDVEFRRRLANRFGQERCWLVGDAAHQTSPVGMQSMNVGLCEAQELARSLAKILRHEASLDLLQIYQEHCLGEWGQLLGMHNPPKARPEANATLKSHSTNLVSCLPATGEHLVELLDQLHFTLPDSASP